VWLDQARSDLRAARAAARGEAECHRRYWYQQCCEKAIKANAITLLESTERSTLAGFRDTFLRHHAPLAVGKDQDVEEVRERLRRAYPEDWKTIERTVLNVRRLTEAFVDNLRHARAIRKIDATRPSLSADAPSCRYPFYVTGCRCERLARTARCRGTHRARGGGIVRRGGGRAAVAGNRRTLEAPRLRRTPPRKTRWWC
jgi:HEPN domain-containing protein